jgi:hypothetical protein
MGEGLIDADGALGELGGVPPQNQPPGPFDLLAPTDGATIGLPYTFDWEDSVDPDADDVIYTLRYADNPNFDNFSQVGQLTESEHTFGVGDLTPGTTYWWKVRARDDEPLYRWSNQTWKCTISTSGADDEDPGTPIVYSLSPAAPNPSLGNAVISYALPRTSNVSLVVYDIRGRKVATLVEAEQAPGYYDASVNGLSSGVYVYRLCAGEFSATKKMVVVR